MAQRLRELTGIPLGDLRSAMNRPPFLILKEHSLTEAVAVRRELERLGLELRLETVMNPTGDSTHPLAGNEEKEDPSPPPVEIILEEGKDFRQVPKPASDEKNGKPSRPKARSSSRSDESGKPDTSDSAKKRKPQEPQESKESQENRPTEKKPKRPFPLAALLIAFGGLAILVAALIQFWPKSISPEDARSLAYFEHRLARLEESLETALQSDIQQPKQIRALMHEADNLESMALSAWQKLPEGLLKQLERAQSLRQTLEMRQAAKPIPVAPDPPPSPQALMMQNFLLPDGVSLLERARQELSSRSPARSLTEQMRLESLLERMQQIQANSQHRLHQRLTELLEKQQAGLLGFQARVLLGQVQQKGILFSDGTEGPQLLTDLPDGCRLQWNPDGSRSYALTVQEGRVALPLVRSEDGKFLAVHKSDMAYTFRLAPVSEQPTSLQNILDLGLSLYDPELYYATLPVQIKPGRWLPPDQARLDSSMTELGELIGSDLSEGKWQAKAGNDPMKSLLRIGRLCREARRFPAKVQIKTTGGLFSLTGMELLLLTREAGSNTE